MSSLLVVSLQSLKKQVQYLRVQCLEVPVGHLATVIKVLVLKLVELEYFRHDVVAMLGRVVLETLVKEGGSLSSIP